MSYKFDVNEQVVVKHTKYKEVPIGAVGTVFKYYNQQVCVCFAQIRNPRSSYNCFYFEQRDLDHYTNNIECKKELKIMEGNYRIAQVSFLEGNNTDVKYPYACYDSAIVEGDICVVMSAHHGLGIAKVIEIGPKTDEKITREIVCKCDFDEYNDRVAIRKRRAVLLKQMHARAAELQEIALFQMLADNDQDMQNILSEYQKLGEVM